MAAPICKLSINERKQNNCQGKIWQIKENQFNILERSQYGYLKFFFFFFPFLKREGNKKRLKLNTRCFLEKHICMDLIYAKIYTVFYQKATNLFDRHSIWLWYIDIIYLQIVMLPAQRNR